jgi:ABC-2 type transport system permease protein
MKIARDTWLVFGRYLGQAVRNPAWLLVGALQPLLYLFLFAPLLKSVAGVRGFPPGGAYNVFVPGLLIQLAFFGTAFAGFGLVAELRGGVIERLRVTPVARVALLLGRALRDVVVLLVQCAVIVLVSLPFGLTINTAGLLVSLTLLALVGLMTAALSYAVALWLKSEDALAPILSTVTVPLLLLSGVLLPLSLAPAWLRAVALANPLAYAVDATRALFNDHLADASVPKGVVIMAVLMVASVVTAARAYGRAVA